MPEFTVAFRMMCSGTITVRANSAKDAEKQVENTALSRLGEEAEDGEVEIVSINGEGE